VSYIGLPLCFENLQLNYPDSKGTLNPDDAVTKTTKALICTSNSHTAQEGIWQE
jgi:hypothetical protein